MNLSGASLRHSNDDNAIFETNYKKCDALKTEGNTYAKLEVDDPVQVGN